MPRPALIVTRPEPQARRFVAEVEARLPGVFAPLPAPLTSIVPLAADLSLDGVQGVLLTSGNAVERLAEATARRDLAAFCVGRRTAEAARRAGFDARSADGAVADLVALVRAALPPGARLLHVRGRHVAGDLAGQLHAAGYTVAEAVLYDQVALPLTAAARAALAGPGCITLFSPRAARLLAGAGAAPGPEMVPVCLSANVAQALHPWRGAAPRIAARPDAEAMLDVLAEWRADGN